MTLFDTIEEAVMAYRVYPAEAIEPFVDCYFDNLYDLLAPEMPYGTQKAQDGDPYQWIDEYLYTAAYGDDLAK